MYIAESVCVLFVTLEGQSEASQGQSSKTVTTGEEGKSKPQLPSFWVPSLTPDAKPTEIKKPVCDSLCIVPFLDEC